MYHQPSPSAHSPDGFEVIDYYSHRLAGAADAAREVEESVLGINTSGKGSRKRAAPGEASDSSSEIDVPIAARQNQHKRRKLAKSHMQDITAELEAPGDMSSMTGTIPLAIKPHTGRGRGKGKQREDHPESASSTPRRRKPGPKKKIDILPPQTQEALGLTAASLSTSRDASPAGSRAASPALTNVSATIYELDEEIPALKKAKRIDDVGMWKRVRTLEEAQRKVWTNIARRDVVKVRPVSIPRCTNSHDILMSGLSVPLHRVSIQASTAQACSNHVIFASSATSCSDSKGDERCAGEGQASYARDVSVLEEE